MMYLVRVFAIAITFQEFTFIVKYCLFISAFGAHSLYLISYKQKKVMLVFRIHLYLKRCAQINVDMQNDAYGIHESVHLDNSIFPPHPCRLGDAFSQNI